MDTHYACPGGCGGMSSDPKTCDTEGCRLNGQMMKECQCQDHQHDEIMEGGNELV